MRPRMNLRAPALLGAAGVLLMGMTDAAPARADQLAMSLSDATLSYGQPLVVQGSARAPAQLALQYRARGEDWRVVQNGTAGADGRYRFRTLADRSGDVRVVPTDAVAASTAGDNASAPKSISVAAAIAGPRGPVDARAGGWATLRGVLRPARAARQVVLEARGRKVARA